jgi:hypothetical protein
MLFLLAVAPLIVAIVLYGDTLRLPFFLDDGLLFEMIRTEPGTPFHINAFLGLGSFAYYRPIPFALWELQQIVLGGGRFEPASLHALNVLAFGLAGICLSKLAWCMTGSRWMGGLSGIGLVAFPFSYNAVNWVASQFHVFALLGLCGALWLVWIWLDEGKLPVLLAGLAMAFFGIFSHENGLLIAPLSALLIVLHSGFRALLRRRALSLLIPLSGLCAAYLLGYATAYRLRFPTELHLNSALDSLGLFAQGLGWPLAAAIRRIFGGDADTLGLLLVGLLPTAALMAVAHRNPALRRVAWFGVAIWLIGALPTIFLLDATYVLGSWRLMLFSSAGIALVWAAGLTGLLRSRRRIAQAIAVAVMLWSAVVSISFLGQRRVEAHLQAAYANDLQASLIARPAQKPLLINAPSFLASPEDQRWFLTVGTGVMFHADYVNHAQVFRAQTGIEFPRIETAIAYQVFNAPPDQNFAPFQTLPDTDLTNILRMASDIYVTVWRGADFYPMYVGGANLPGSTEILVRWPDVGLTLNQATLSAGRPRHLTLTAQWTVDAPVTAQIVVDIHCEGEIVGQSIAGVWGGLYPFDQWRAGESQTDARDIYLIREVDPACLETTLYVIEPDSGVPYPAFDVNGAPRAADRLTLELLEGR